MTHKQFFQLQAGNLLRDYKTQHQNESGGVSYKPRFFDDVVKLVDSVAKDGKFTLMNAQYVIALLAGFKTWNELGKASETMLELGKLLLENRDDISVAEWLEYIKGRKTINPFHLDWTDELVLNEFKTRFLPKNSPYRKGFQNLYGGPFASTNEPGWSMLISNDKKNSIIGTRKATDEEALSLKKFGL